MKIRMKKCILLCLVALLFLGVAFSIDGCADKKSLSEAEKMEDFSGKRIGVQLGSLSEETVKEWIPNAQIVYFSSANDLYLALNSGKIDGYFADEPAAKCTVNAHEDARILQKVQDADYCFVLKKGDANAALVQQQLNAFIADARESGWLQECVDRWFGQDESKKDLDYSSVKTGKNGEIKLALCAEYMPFAYVKGDKTVGFEVDIILSFCKANGYSLSVSNVDFNGILQAVEKGTADIGCCGLVYSEEMQEQMLVSSSTYTGGTVFVTSDNTANHTSFFQTLAESFENTFIRESRWKMFVKGIGNTLLLSVLSVIFGTGLGFGVYYCCRKNVKLTKRISAISFHFIKGLPEIVLLMVLYYIVFAKTQLSGMTISVICFSLLFGCTIFRMFESAEDAMDKGQLEAACSLGFSDTRAFFKVFLPQMDKQILPAFVGEIKSHVKDTAVVGYLAVQDLTKMGNIVIGSTYEAFFPLTVTALFYWGVGDILALAVTHIGNRFERKKQDPRNILKGINRNGN